MATAALYGCRSLPAPPEPTATGAILRYVPASWDEWEAQEALLRSDAHSRRGVALLAARARKREAAFRKLNMRFQGVGADDEAARPAREEMRRAMAEVAQAWAAVGKSMDRQVADYEAFLETYPHNWYARHRLAWYLSDHNRRRRAAEQWRAVIDAEPRFPYAYNNLGSVYVRLGRTADAVDMFQKAIDLHTAEPVFHVNLALCYGEHGEELARKLGWRLPRVFEACIDAYLSARDLAPGDPAVARDLAARFAQAPRFGVEDAADRALKAWEYYLNLPLTPEQRAAGCKNVAHIYMREKGDYDEGIRWMEKAVNLVDNETYRTLFNQALEEWRIMEKSRGRFPPGGEPRDTR
jgi:tetratricopeptide (TPR) repeat protein